MNALTKGAMVGVGAMALASISAAYLPPLMLGGTNLTEFFGAAVAGALILWALE